METFTYQAIGVLRTPYTDPKGAPIQPSGARGSVGRAELEPHLEPALKDLAGFSHLWLIYHCHRVGPLHLVVTPFLDGDPHGVFSVRAPSRPNPMGLSLVRLKAVEGTVLHLLDVDMLDGTPLLDLKPYVPEFDDPEGTVRRGWLEQRAEAANGFSGDDRFGS